MEKGQTAKPTHPLSTLTPEGVATAGAEVMAGYLSFLQSTMYPGPTYLWVPADPAPLVLAIASGAFGWHLKRLTRYAQTGALEESGDVSGLSVQKSAIDVLHALTASPSDRHSFRSHQHVFDSDTPYATVLLAAKARQSLDEGIHAPHVTELAALTDLLPSSLRYLMRQRVVLATDVVDQRRFCVTRGVVGLAGDAADDAASPASSPPGSGALRAPG